MIYVLIYLLVGTVLTLLLEKFIVAEIDAYVEKMHYSKQQAKLFRASTYVLTIIAWPLMFIPRRKKKGDQ